MKSKTMLYVAMVLNLLYAFAMIILFSFQSWIYELVVYDLREQTLFPLYNIAEAVVTFGVVAAMIVLLKNAQETDGKKELAAIVLMMIGLIIGPLIAMFGNSITSHMYAVTTGVDSLAAYSTLSNYIRFVDILGKAAMVFVLAHAAITYGSKKKQDS